VPMIQLSVITRVYNIPFDGLFHYTYTNESRHQN